MPEAKKTAREKKICPARAFDFTKVAVSPRDVKSTAEKVKADGAAATDESVKDLILSIAMVSAGKTMAENALAAHQMCGKLGGETEKYLNYAGMFITSAMVPMFVEHIDFATDPLHHDEKLFRENMHKLTERCVDYIIEHYGTANEKAQKDRDEGLRASEAAAAAGADRG